MKKYQELEQKIQELQKEVDRLKSKERELPDCFDIKNVLKLLDDPQSDYLDFAFQWTDTPQGEDFWNKINHDLYRKNITTLPQEAIDQLKDWVIVYYRNKHQDW